MLRFLKSFFGKTTEPTTEAPYKVEAPVAEPITIAPAPEPVKCGCGRSASGFCVGLHKLTQEEWMVHPDNPRKVSPPEPQTAPEPAKKATKKPAAKKAPAAKKPAAMTAAKKSAAESAPKPRRSKSTKS